jgi:hypothetical protein
MGQRGAVLVIGALVALNLLPTATPAEAMHVLSYEFGAQQPALSSPSLCTVQMHVAERRVHAETLRNSGSWQVDNTRLDQGVSSSKSCSNVWLSRCAEADDKRTKFTFTDAPCAPSLGAQGEMHRYTPPMCQHLGGCEKRATFGLRACDGGIMHVCLLRYVCMCVCVSSNMCMYGWMHVLYKCRSTQSSSSILIVICIVIYVCMHISSSLLTVIYICKCTYMYV